MRNERCAIISLSDMSSGTVCYINSFYPYFLVLFLEIIVFFVGPQEAEEEEEQESPRRRRSMQESLSLPVPVCYPGNGQKDDPGEARDGFRAKTELSSSPSLSASLGDSVESSGSPLSPPKESPHSTSGFMRNVKKRESKGKGKELKGM